MREIAFTILTVGAVGIAGLTPTGLQAAPLSATASVQNPGAKVMLNPQPLPPKVVLARSSTDLVSKTSPNAKFVVPQAVITKPTAGGAMNAFQKAQTGGLGGIGVPGGLGGSGDKTAGIGKSVGIGKEAGLGSIVPSGATGKIKAGVDGIKGSQGQATGREAKDGVSARQMEGMQTAISQAAKTQGKEKGVESSEGPSGRHAAAMKDAIGEAAASQGKETGVEAKEGGYKVSKEQRQAMKDSTFDPKVNPELGSKDPKGDGSTKEPKPKTDGKTGGTNPKTGGTQPKTGETKPKTGETKPKTGGTNPKTGDSKKEPKPVVDKKTGAVMSNIKGNLAGTIWFKPTVIVVKPPKPPKADAVAETVTQ